MLSENEACRMPTRRIKEAKAKTREVGEGERGEKTAEDDELTTEGPGKNKIYHKTEGESKKNCRKK